ncbi:FAD-dependent monooxygenase [Actinomyces lilanjuaniae]|uniref:FAD-dependent monooxygenase n=1 Tax=Actinomyces lilanjuaniae TaxID=2321394 RepID=A0ABM6Z0X5_9ACTO|nr:FAD-dependent monooxygenase [Actinomyces lilanjuaniae]
MCRIYAINPQIHYKGERKLSSDTLIIGGGPSGLTAGCCLAERGQSVRIIRKHPLLTSQSRATVLWPKALEVLDPFGIVDKLRPLGDVINSLSYYSDGRQIGTLSTRLLEGTRFNYALGISQHNVETALTEVFTARGGVIEDAEVTDLTQDEGSVLLTIRSFDGTVRQERAEHCVVADGARSLGREKLGLRMEDLRDTVEFQIADVRAEGLPRDEAFYWWSRHGAMAVAPHDKTTFRLAYPAVKGTPAPDTVSTQYLESLLDQRGPSNPGRHVTQLITAANFVARFAVVDQFAKGRCYLAGDAAHVMAPTGAQNMNAGMLDAVCASRFIMGDIEPVDSGTPLAQLYDKMRRASIDKVFDTALGHARDGAAMTPESIAERDARYALLENTDAARARLTRMSQLDIEA